MDRTVEVEEKEVSTRSGTANAPKQLMRSVWIKPNYCTEPEKPCDSCEHYVFRLKGIGYCDLVKRYIRKENRAS